MLKGIPLTESNFVSDFIALSPPSQTSTILMGITVALLRVSVCSSVCVCVCARARARVCVCVCVCVCVFCM